MFAGMMLLGAWSAACADGGDEPSAVVTALPPRAHTTGQGGVAGELEAGAAGVASAQQDNESSGDAATDESVIANEDSVSAASGADEAPPLNPRVGALHADDGTAPHQRGLSTENGAGIAAVTGTPEQRIPANETIVSINTPTPTATRTSTPTPTTAPGSPPTVGGCQVFPADNAWNTDISNYPVHPNSANYVAAINAGGKTKLHPDWGGNGQYGIPYVVVPPNQPLVSITWTAYGDESDPGPYPIPLNAPIEGGPSSDGDRHAIAVRQGECVLYELYRAFPGASSWEADSGAKWPLNTNALRPLYWTSADAAGLPILPGLVRYEEVAGGEIRHALRFTSWRTQRGFILPATHYASNQADPNNYPPMGLRFRLKASYDISGFTGQTRVVLEALKKYGMIVADNGSSWYITGAADPRWNDNDLNQLKTVPSSAFEAVYTGDVIR